MPAREINFDGIVGPTHNYAGLSYGNVASMTHKAAFSSPKRAALEGLTKMKFLMDLGLKQAVLPPHERPHIPTLRSLGFTGSDAQVLHKAHRDDPRMLAAASSASGMWAANAATVSPSADTQDGRVHFTPANLISNVHRAIEAPLTTRILRTIFADERHFIVHDPLPSDLPDEGAANHTRLCADYDAPGFEVFVYGRATCDLSRQAPKRFPARQTLDASRAIARRHQLHPARVIFVQQQPDAIDAGAFHADVVAVGNRDVLLYHQRAFVDLPRLESTRLIEVYDSDVPLSDAISSYLFNSQLVTLPDGSMAIIAPAECQQFPAVADVLRSVGPVHYVDVRQSMHNGGGPACLRLRVVLTDDQDAAMQGNVVLTPWLYDQLKAWIEKHYRDELRPGDLRAQICCKKAAWRWIN